MDFQTFHRYNRLARRGLVKPLTCPDCGLAYVTGFGEDDEPVLRCFECDSTVQPGLRVYEEIRAVVKEHYA